MAFNSSFLNTVMQARGSSANIKIKREKHSGSESVGSLVVSTYTSAKTTSTNASTPLSPGLPLTGLLPQQHIWPKDPDNGSCSMAQPNEANPNNANGETGPIHWTRSYQLAQILQPMSRPVTDQLDCTFSKTLGLRAVIKKELRNYDAEGSRLARALREDDGNDGGEFWGDSEDDGSNEEGEGEDDEHDNTNDGEGLPPGYILHPITGRVMAKASSIIFGNRKLAKKAFANSWDQWRRGYAQRRSVVPPLGFEHGDEVYDFDEWEQVKKRRLSLRTRTKGKGREY